eukprot:15426395-Alexandrium_andersonii.AAC.1
MAPWNGPAWGNRFVPLSDTPWTPVPWQQRARGAQRPGAGRVQWACTRCGACHWNMQEKWCRVCGHARGDADQGRTTKLAKAT